MWLILALSFIPLVGLVGSLGYEQSKVITLIFCLSLLSLTLLKINKGQFKLTRIKIAAGLFILSLGLASFLGLDFQKSLVGEGPYFQGFITYLFLFWLFLLVSLSKINILDLSKDLIISAILVSALALKDFLLLNIFHQNVANYAGRVVSSFGQPNFYAGFLLLALPFCFCLKKGHLRNSGFLAILGGILVSQSKTAIGILGLLVFIWLVNKLSFSKIIYIFSGLLLGLAVFLSVFITEVGPIWLEVGAPMQNVWLFHNAPEKRILVWKVLFDQSLKRPVFGYGIDNLNQVYSSFNPGEPPWPAWFTLKNLYVDRSHNYLLDLYFFGGFLTLGSFAWLVYLLLKKARGYVLLSLIIFLAWMQFQNLSIVHLMIFWLLIGMIDKEEKRVFT